MFRIWFIAALLSVASAAHADVESAVKHAATATAHGLEKAQDAVVHAAHVAASGVSYGLKKTGEAVDKGARKIGLPAGEPPKSPVKPSGEQQQPS